MTNFNESFGEIYSAFKQIGERCEGKFQQGCGSYLFDGQRYEYYPGMYWKQELLFQAAKNVNSVLEVGTYIGHSALIMLIANPRLKITTIDIDPTYAVPAVEVLKKLFPNAQIDLLIGDSLEVMPKLLNDQKNKYDLFHIDGYHTADVVSKEYDLCKKLSSSNILNVVFDDIDTCAESIEMISKSEKIEHLVLADSPWRNGQMIVNMNPSNFVLS